MRRFPAIAYRFGPGRTRFWRFTLCAASLLPVPGCSPSSTEPGGAGEPQARDTELVAGRIDADPFLRHLATLDVVEQNPEAQGAIVVGGRSHTRVIQFVNYLGSQGIALRYDEQRREWRVLSPSFGDHQVRIESIAAFPESANLLEMQIGCLMINLFHGLNPRAKLIMSLPGLVRISDEAGTPQDSERADEVRSSPRYIAFEKRLKQLFVDYAP